MTKHIGVDCQKNTNYSLLVIMAFTKGFYTTTMRDRINQPKAGRHNKDLPRVRRRSRDQIHKHNASEVI